MEPTVVDPWFSLEYFVWKLYSKFLNFRVVKLDLITTEVTTTFYPTIFSYGYLLDWLPSPERESDLCPTEHEFLKLIIAVGSSTEYFSKDNRRSITSFCLRYVMEFLQIRLGNTHW